MYNKYGLTFSKTTINFFFKIGGEGNGIHFFFEKNKVSSDYCRMYVIFLKSNSI